MPTVLYRSPKPARALGPQGAALGMAHWSMGMVSWHEVLDMALGIGHPAVGAILAEIDTNFCYREKAYYKTRLKAGVVKTILSDKLKFEGVASPVSGGLHNIISCLAMRHAPCAMRHTRIWCIDIAAAPEKSG